MPLYEVSHCTPLTSTQKDALAIMITDSHCNNTGALRLFVHVIFKDTSSNPYQYSGGKRHPTNRIIAITRDRGEAGIEVLEDISKEIQAGWEKEVGKTGDEELTAVFITDGLKAGMEKGFLLPRAYEDNEWFEKHKMEFEKRAKEGDSVFQDLLDQNNVNFLKNNR